MVPFQRPNSLFLLVIFSLSTVLAACSSGGGGKGGPAPNPADTRPDSFTITASAGEDPSEVPFDTEITSAPITITGIDAAAAVSINNGEFQIDNGTFTSTAGTVRSGQTVTVRVRSSVKAGQSVTATLNVGGVTAPFTVTTGPDTEPPEVAILFPPPASMTEGSTLFLRGTVKDVNGTLGEGAVTVNGVEAALELNAAGDEGTWSVTVELAEGDNTVPVVAWDVAGNRNDVDESSVSQISTRRVANIEAESFPNDEAPFNSPTGITVSTDGNRAVAYVVDTFGGPVIEVDMATGSRRIVSSNDTQAEPAFVRPMYITEGEDDLLYIGDRRGGQIYSLNKATGARSLLDLDALEEFEDDTFDLTTMDYDHKRHLLYVAKGPYVFSINPADGKMTILAQMSDPNVFSLEGLTIDQQNETVLVTNYSPRTIASISLTTGNIDLLGVGEFTNGPFIGPIKIAEQDKAYVINRLGNLIHYPNLYEAQSSPVLLGEDFGENPSQQAWDLDLNAEAEYLLVTDIDLKGILAIDAISGRRVVLSKSQTAN